ncbi:Uncharacterised protein [Klebsiella pneumoniae]|nr:Uncharacterised protein [Klebsiella pneumoniae]
MAHCILHRDQILPLFQHGGREGTPQIVRRALTYPGLALAHLQDMVHRLVGEPVQGHIPEAADAGEQRPGRLTPDCIDPDLQPRPGPGRNVSQALLIPLAQHPQDPVLRDNVTDIQANGFGPAQAAAEDDRQHGCIPWPQTAAVGLTDGKQSPDLLRRQGPAGRQPGAAQVAHRPDVLEALHVHQAEHPGFLRHPLEGRQVGVDGGRGPAGVAQQLGNAHDVMPAQAAPAAGVRAYGPEHPGDDPEERGHGLPAAG